MSIQRRHWLVPMVSRSPAVRPQCQRGNDATACLGVFMSDIIRIHLNQAVSTECGYPLERDFQLILIRNLVISDLKAKSTAVLGIRQLK